LATGWTLQGLNPGASHYFRTCPEPNLLYNGNRVFPGGKERPGRDADPSSPSNAVGRKACTEHQCLYKGDLYFYLNNRCSLVESVANGAEFNGIGNVAWASESQKAESHAGYCGLLRGPNVVKLRIIGVRCRQIFANFYVIHAIT
jgi:hypothetical protein